MARADCRFELTPARAAGTILLAMALVAGLPGRAGAQRLPPGVTPVHYDLTVAPDLAAARFTGHETIAVTLGAPSTAVVLNAAEIEFGRVRITAAGRTQEATVSLDPAKDQATFSVPAPVPAGSAVIEIDYTGILNDDLRGLYLSTANNRRYAVSQLEATDARRMFPSFDEPSFKATFSLTAIIDAGDSAISNGAVVSDTPGPSAGKHTVRFETTPKMSSYLVALAVGDFVCNDGAADGIPIRICATPDKKALTSFALEAAEQILRYYDGYFGIKYPFKKLDIVAVPDFAAGAMENTAAIFYRETLLLADSDASVATRKEIAGVLAHEMAHQWFGDLVTMAWWDDIWLNEGFANWMQSKPLAAWKPEWHLALSETADNQTAMRLDALRSTRAIRAHASTPAQINELFDPIAYEKGAAVLRMIESWVGEQPFREAINAYVGRYKYSNARAEDFWNTVTATTGKPADRVMRTFVDQPGLPLVTATAACSAGKQAVTLSQSRFALGDSSPSGTAAGSWQIPVCFHADGVNDTTCTLLDAPRKTVTLPSCPAWTMTNADGRGYYRTSPAAALLEPLEANVTKLTPPERLTLVADQWALVRGGLQDVGSYLDLASAFGTEKQEAILAELTQSLAFIDEYLTTPESRPAFRAWMAGLLGPAAATARTSTNGASSPDAAATHALVLRRLGDAGEPTAVREARRLVDEELATPGSVPSVLLDAAVDVAAVHGDKALYDKFLARGAAAVNPQERYRFLYALTEFTDPALIRRTFDYVVGPDVRSQDMKGLLAALLGNPAARDVTWDLLRERWTAVQQKAGEFVGDTVVIGALSSFCDTGHAREIEAFFAAHPVPDAERTLAQALERIHACATLSSAQTNGLATWVKARGAPGTVR
jgi:aminopeptidase N